MEYRLREAPKRWMGLMNTQSKPIAFARVRCMPHCVNGPASKGNKLYKIMRVALNFPENDACRRRRQQAVVSAVVSALVMGVRQNSSFMLPAAGHRCERPVYSAYISKSLRGDGCCECSAGRGCFRLRISTRTFLIVCSDHQ